MKTIEGKIVILGAQGVGKTSMVVRYVGKLFSPHVSPTIGATFFTCKINIDDIKVKLQVWDTAGQERFKAMTPMYYRNANAALLVFDLTRYSTFEAVKVWVKELQRNVEEPMVICVVGNKTDLIEDRKVDRDEALSYSKSIGGSYFEASALQDQGIEQVFFQVALGLIRLSGENVENSSLRVYNTDETGAMATSSELRATDVGTTETASWSIDSIAHADSLKPNMCC